LRALKLDPQRMFDKLIGRYAPSMASRDAILSDRIYRNLSAALSGVADYMAMEQLLDLRHEGFADLIVLDTPPAREAIDFLDAPRRMLDLLNSRALTLLGASREMMRGPFGIFDFAARAVLTAFDRLTGLHLLADVQSFVTRFDGMYGGFAARAGQARELIESERTLIILVTTADTERLEQTREFIASLRGLGLRADAIAINRMMPPLPDGTAIDSARITATMKRKLRRNLQDFEALKQRENASLRLMRAEAPPDTRIITAPDLGREPSALADLAEIASQLRVLT
jgi:anion-transporting  ArsA/GET3 family ATPase